MLMIQLIWITQCTQKQAFIMCIYIFFYMLMIIWILRKRLVSWSTSELRVRLAPWNRFKPSSKIFYWPFQGDTSFVDLLCFFLSCVCYAFVPICLYVPCGHLLGKGWPLGSCFWCLTVSLSLSHWYPGSGVVLDCIDSWSLHPYLLCYKLIRISFLHIHDVLTNRLIDK